MSEAIFTVEGLSFLGKGPFSFSLMKGECVGINGHSGIGKTQLFRALTDLQPSMGSIALHGLSSVSVSAPLWRKRVSMLPTDTVWWFDSVGEHFASFTEDDSAIEQQLTALGLRPEVMRWQTSRISTGEKQRLALLRALQTDPEILLLDEPSSGLDAFHTELMECYLKEKRAKEGLTLMWVSHDYQQLARVTDRILQMTKNTLVELSTVTEEPNGP
jgi:ABC-type dipeptide/oligopeptide/nickel transport system ATPase subunit